MSKIISPELGAELKRLYADLPKAQKRVSDALRTGGVPLEGQALAKLMKAHDEESAIVRRIREICG